MDPTEGGERRKRVSRRISEISGRFEEGGKGVNSQSGGGEESGAERTFTDIQTNNLSFCVNLKLLSNFKRISRNENESSPIRMSASAKGLKQTTNQKPGFWIKSERKTCCLRKAVIIYIYRMIICL